MVRLVCDLCARRGQYRKETLIARFSGDVLMPAVRHLIAQCPRKDAPGQACGVYYVVASAMSRLPPPSSVQVRELDLADLWAGVRSSDKADERDVTMGHILP
jgi:hypothetical protein